MASFVVTGPNAPSQTLLNNQFGVVARGATLQVSGADAVNKIGSSSLTVGGLITSDTGHGVLSFSDSDIMVDQGGSIVSGASPGVGYSAFGERTITNSGNIFGSSGIQTLSFTGLVDDQVPIISTDISNSGVISGYRSAGIDLVAQGNASSILNSGTLSGSDTGVFLRFSENAVSTGVIINSGLVRGGTTGVTLVSSGGDNTFSLRNSGTIVGGDLAFHGSIEAEEIVNTGEMIGDIELGDGDDTVESSSGRIIGDVLGDLGNDTLLGGDSSDRFSGGSDNDLLRGGAGDDMLAGDDGTDTVAGGTGDDMLTGGDGVDLLDGGDGDDFLDGGADADTLYGGRDDDTLGGGSGADSLHGGEGDDSLYGGEDDDQLSGGSGADTLYGDAGEDTVLGDAGDDMLVGGSGRDTLKGGSGDDTLVGGEGDAKDHLWGGSGTDIFVYESIEQIGTTPTNDAIMDFESGVDRLDLTALGRLAFSGEAAAGGGVASVWQRTLNAFPATIVLVDVDGDGNKDAALLLFNGAPITFEDLIL